MELYTPKDCTTLDKLGISQIRLGIQGPPFSGKTTACLTFPNPVVASFDRKVTAHSHRFDVIVVPFFDDKFIDSISLRSSSTAPANRKDALLVWLDQEGKKLSPAQTLILDGSTGIEEAYHTQYEQEPVYTSNGQKDAFAEWRLKNNFFGDIHAALKSLSCNVIYITHETPDRDKKGELNGKIRPLLTGQAGDKLAGNFTDWFRSITISKPNTQEQKQALIDWSGADSATIEEWIKSTPREHSTIYLWQTSADEKADCGTTSLFNCPKYVLAEYKTFEKYKRKPITQQ